MVIIGLFSRLGRPIIPVPRKLLLVEDEAIIAMAQAHILENFGYEVATAITGEKAVELVQAEPAISLILMDIDLGKGIDGTETARRILAKRNLPIVFLTSHAERELVEKVRGITRYGYVIKNSGNFVLQSSIEMAFELFNANEKMEREENRLRTLIQTIPDLVWLKDKDGVYLQCNWMFERFFGAKEEAIIGKTDFDFLSKEEADFFRMHDRLAMEADKPTRNEEWIIFADDGRRALLETIKTPLKDERGNLIGILGISRDITEHKRTEESLELSKEALRESEERVKAKLETILSPEGDIGALELSDIIDVPLLQSLMDDFVLLTKASSAILDDKGRVLVATGWQDICTRFHRVNPESRRYCLESDLELTAGIKEGSFKAYRCKNSLWDIATPIYIGGKPLGNIFLGQFFYDDDVIDYDAFRAQARRYAFDEGEYIAALDRVPRWSHEMVQAIMRFYTNLAGILGNLSYGNIKLARALAEQERLLAAVKENEEKFRIIANYTVDWESWLSMDGTYLWVNPGVKKITGYTDGEILAMPNPWDTLVVKDDRERVLNIIRTATPSSNGDNFEFRFKKKSGEERWLSASWQAIVGWGGAFAGLRVSGRDITARKLAEEKLAGTLQGKEVLLRELKHRVKNSLAIVSSLLSLSARTITDKSDSRIFLESTGRINTISAIYEQLSLSESFDNIDIDVYIRDLVIMLSKAYTADSDNIRFICKIENMTIPLGLAAPLGLIINELITNSIKYAYPNGLKGEVRIGLERSGESAVMTIADDGPGLPEGVDPEQTSGIGLRIVGMMAKQINGKLRFERGKGTTAVLIFPPNAFNPP